VGNNKPSLGHNLPLTFGFTFETMQAIGDFFISGAMDKVQGFKILPAHCGGVLG